ncbi:aminoglycoside phosphotransferase family protein [Aurantiacibacter sp. D1-12]|uniref:aminoglycoside phosphotransferase family protein n=1 Tax=Aurantiacibacter sp. D1-12 TaxID=2993658 RepID=UPI00237D18AC|nr:phosphotransferase [Aurantiacibacter sp. D1-12]MDE1466535.1 phosphotransferase [Aurantiacibacter sp. D1-12]
MSEFPDGMHQFLASAGWDDAQIHAIPGDASFRRYFRLNRDSGESAMLMYAPPPEEDPKPFLHVARWLSDNDMRAPAIFSEDAAQGWVLTEDFGDDRMKEWIEANPTCEVGAYASAIDAIGQLHRRAPGPFPAYDIAVYQREAGLLTEWFCPAANLDVDAASFRAAWDAVLAPVLAEQQPGVTVLRDYHAENIMMLDPDGEGQGEQGIIDFQDALVGHPAYDLVSLLQDARRDVSPELEAKMLGLYEAEMQPDWDVAASYAVLGAQRNAKIVGIFTRLWKRDGKPRYLGMIPRVWEAMERDLQHPALAPVAQWFDANIPGEIREKKGAVLG